jgi:hypothetical protein
MKSFIYITFFSCFAIYSMAQNVNQKPTVVRTDSTTSIKNSALTKDTAIRVSASGDTTKVVPKHSPRIATMRSAILPGWGQVYNREAWKLPLVYAAIGIPAGFFIYNNTWYKRSKLAYEIKVDNDTARFGEINEKLLPLNADNLRFYRNEFRRNRDYSALFFLLAWGLNVVDATVFAHLKDFNVSDDLSLKLKPNFDMKNTGVSLVLAPKLGVKNRLLQSR